MGGKGRKKGKVDRNPREKRGIREKGGKRKSKSEGVGGRGRKARY